MGIEISRPYSIGGITPNINTFRNKYISFGNTGTDTFECSSPNRYTTEYSIRKMIDNNPKIKAITKDFNPNTELNMEELNELLKNHATDTKNIAQGITEYLPFSLKNKVNTTALDKAAYLHDLGKVLIPREVLNKPGKLNDLETKIMHTHSELSYELLKNSNLDQTTLNLIRNHHQNAKKTGYPRVGRDFNADLNLQILSVADKYSALTEKRTYKEPLSEKEALTIIYQDVKEEKLHPLVFNALVNFVNDNAADKIAQKAV